MNIPLRLRRATERQAFGSPRRTSAAACVCAVLLLAAGPAAGQEAAKPAVEAPPVSPADPQSAPDRGGRPFLDGRFMVGLSGSHALTTDSDLGQKWSLSPVFRPTPSRNGWSPAFGLNWYDGDIKVNLGGQDTVVGHLRLRPVMLGIGYSFGTGRTRTTFSLVGGYAFNSAVVDENLPAGTTASVSVSDAWAIRPGVSVTYAFTRRFALLGSIGYVYMNPAIRVSVNRLGNRMLMPLDDYRSDYINVSIGTAFSIF